MSSFEEVINYTNSSLIKRVWYSKPDADLLIEFTNGRSYMYYNVPESVVKDFIKSECSWEKSLGKFYNANIRDRYESMAY